MAAVLEITPEERPVLAFILARWIPVLRRGTAENREVAGSLRYTLQALDEAPEGAGEVELLTQDLYEFGLHVMPSSTDLEEYWLDRVEVANGRPAVEQTDPEVEQPARLYFPDLDANPLQWEYRRVQPAFLSIGMKAERAVIATAPRVRGIYSKEWSTALSLMTERRERNSALRGHRPGVPVGSPQPALAAPTVSTVTEDGHAAEQVSRPRPQGSAMAPAGRAAAGQTALSRATYPTQYLWGVETGTGVHVDDLQPGKVKRVSIGGANLMLAEADGKVCAAARTCPHRDWDLSKSDVVDGTITCSLHGAKYDICSGAVLREPYDPEFNRDHALMGKLMSGVDPKKNTDRLQTYPTVVGEDGMVRIHI